MMYLLKCIHKKILHLLLILLKLSLSAIGAGVLLQKFIMQEMNILKIIRIGLTGIMQMKLLFYCRRLMLILPVEMVP